MVLSSQPDIPIFPPDALLSDEPPLETARHLKQLILLLTCLERLWNSRTDFFTGGNLSIYYSTRQRKSEAAQQQLQTERQRADQAEAQVAVFLRKLQELGIDPADL